MSTFREQLIERMLNIYAESNPAVQDVVRMCEDWDDTNWNDQIIETIVKAHEANPFGVEY